MDEAAAVISFLGIHSVQEWQALPNDRKQLYVPTNAAGVLQSSGSNWRHALSSLLLADLTDGCDPAEHLESGPGKPGASCEDAMVQAPH